MSDADLMRRAAARLREVLPSFTDPRHYANHDDIALVRDLEARSPEDEEGPPEAYSCHCGGHPDHPRSPWCGS